MSDLLCAIAAIFIIYLLAKFMKPILKACASILAIIVMLAFTIGLFILFRLYGVTSFLVLMFFFLFVIVEVVALIYAIIKKISSFWE